MGKIITFSILDENYKKLEKFCMDRAINRSLFIVQSILKNIEEENDKNQNRSSRETGKRISNNNRKGSGKKRPGTIQSTKRRTLGGKSGHGNSKSNSGKSIANSKTKGSTQGTKEIKVSDF